MSKEKSKLQLLEEILEDHPGEYPSATVKRVRNLVLYVEENNIPLNMIPYDDLDFPNDWYLYFTLTPEWRNKPKKLLRLDEQFGGRYFVEALKQRCMKELSMSDYFAEHAVDTLILDFNQGQLVWPSSLKPIKEADSSILRNVSKTIIEMMKKRRG